jgi:arginyl-tRNA--protein-N-Asp/Glu arginylyltransferase
LEEEDHIPLDLRGHNLDLLLEMGYYRMRQNVFTTDEFYDSQTERAYDCFWLRTRLDLIKDVQKHKIYKLNKRFSVEIGDAVFNDEINSMFETYRQAMDFDAHESVFHFLLNSDKMVEFNSKSIQIRDEGKLIAVAYFDEGHSVIMGNMNFYHPDYKKFSLGKYLMLLKIDYAQSKKMDYYYTGYIALGNTKFDYKLFPDANSIEVLLKQEENTWFPYTSLGKDGLKEKGGFWVNMGDDFTLL